MSNTVIQDSPLVNLPLSCHQCHFHLLISQKPHAVTFTVFIIADMPSTSPYCTDTDNSLWWLCNEFQCVLCSDDPNIRRHSSLSNQTTFWHWHWRGHFEYPGSHTHLWMQWCKQVNFWSLRHENNSYHLKEGGKGLSNSIRLYKYWNIFQVCVQAFESYTKVPVSHINRHILLCPHPL